MTRRVRRLPVINPQPAQLVLGLSVGLVVLGTKRKRRAPRLTGPAWVAAKRAKAA